MLNFFAAELVDPLLSSANVSQWTPVTSDNDLLRKLIHAYFMYDHPFLTVVHKDYFLRDLASGRHRFCSDLLVNALLAQAYKTHSKMDNRVEFWNPRTLGYQFSAEARRLWEFEAGRSKITTVQAAMLMNISYSENGMDKIGWAYLVQAVDMSHDLHIFDTSTDIKSAEMENVRAFTAWSLFNYQTLMTYHFHKPPLLKGPPNIDLPDPVQNPGWYGEMWIRYPLSQTLSPTYFGLGFQASAAMQVMKNDMGLEMYGNLSGSGKLSVAQTKTLFQRLTAWFDSLPGPLKPQRIVLPLHFKIHAYYFHIISDLFQPLAADPVTATIKFMGRTPQEIISYALTRMETLARLYYLRHSFDYYDACVLQFLIPLAYSALSQIFNADSTTPLARLNALRSTLVLCAKGIGDQGQSFYIAKAVFRMIREKMRPEDHRLMNRFAQSKELEDVEPLISHHVQSQWPMPIIRVDRNPSTNDFEELVKEYKKLSMEGEDEEDCSGLEEN
ncbi:uncharacterized protein BDR25DRAFT_381964 [Lindgomyces ingoldianus]|uniref:Uncharacterized protein n=1 Tax=Lindgomyces ingoldianus TaxID=673940 RepID=A0ACB6R7H9_9PLEO|nr:uncharacterized protein BDR25DRAFT_381964 [Lindgomyces ingoldianus]KAF2475141.1 hypothetical protein BDR25DRAFT_381964 [Lindgomyces ingoldianus]